MLLVVLLWSSSCPNSTCGANSMLHGCQSSLYHVHLHPLLHMLQHLSSFSSSQCAEVAADAAVAAAVADVAAAAAMLLLLLQPIILLFLLSVSSHLAHQHAFSYGPFCGFLLSKAAGYTNCTWARMLHVYIMQSKANKAMCISCKA